MNGLRHAIRRCSERFEPAAFGAGFSILAWLLVCCIGGSCVAADEVAAAARYREHVQPILEKYCYGCHGYGASEGGRTLDEFESDSALVANRDLWWAVLKNVRAGIMPPAGEDRPDDDERRVLSDWIKYDAFAIDPDNPDPGRVTLHRLNRVEYRNTIRDLTGVDFDTSSEFPVDDSGYGFDNIGDVLSLSPLLLEKYLRAAEQIAARALPEQAYSLAERRIPGDQFHSDDHSATGDRMSYYTAATVASDWNVEKAGTYRIVADLELDGKFEFDPGRCRVAFLVDGVKLQEAEFSWADNEPRRFEVTTPLTAGAHRLAFQLEPLVDKEQQLHQLDFCVRSVVARGPTENANAVEDKKHRRFLPKGPAPDDAESRDAYAREVLAAFVRRAYRRPVDEPTINRLVELARATYSTPDESFEAGIRQAMIAVLASPRFLFRTEDVVGQSDGDYPQIDEHALASRLSYLLWSSMPDDELMELADEGRLRTELPTQVSRMLKDRRANEFSKNFAGQWLRSRDVEHFAIDPIDAMGFRAEWDALRGQLWKLRESRARKAGPGDAGDRAPTDEERQRDAEAQRLRDELQRFRQIREMFSHDLRRAMRRETEMAFEHIVRRDRSVLELVDSDYTFLNETLAKHYGIDGVTGREMRRVDLPPDSPRGGVLTQGTLLVVTSNPTRTSPVKRGLYILGNFLGTPSPPPPPDVPPLEASAKAISGHEPTIRELQEQHRRDPLCSSCHARMDPLGLALENFNAMGMWRDSEQGRPIDASGTLLTGEEFGSIRDIKKIIAGPRRLDFYRCLSEKLLTYALGRGLEYYDEHTVDEIVERLEREDGKFSAVLMGVIESAPFQRQRRAEGMAATK